MKHGKWAIMFMTTVLSSCASSPSDYELEMKARSLHQKAKKDFTIKLHELFDQTPWGEWAPLIEQPASSSGSKIFIRHKQISTPSTCADLGYRYREFVDVDANFYTLKSSREVTEGFTARKIYYTIEEGRVYKGLYGEIYNSYRSYLSIDCMSPDGVRFTLSQMINRSGEPLLLRTRNNAISSTLVIWPNSVTHPYISQASNSYMPRIMDNKRDLIELSLDAKDLEKEYESAAGNWTLRPLERRIRFTVGTSIKEEKVIVFQNLRRKPVVIDVVLYPISGEPPDDWSRSASSSSISLLSGAWGSIKLDTSGKAMMYRIRESLLQ